MFTDGFAVAGDGNGVVELEFDDGVRIVIWAGAFHQCFQRIVVNSLDATVTSLVMVALEYGEDLIGFLQSSPDVTGVLDVVGTGAIEHLVHEKDGRP